jgi:hypothetical protein
MLEGWKKEDPPTMKQLPVEADVPEYLCLLGNSPSATKLEAVVGDSVVVAFYYLLRVGEYTTKGTKQYTKQTVQFKLEDATFFKKDTTGRLRRMNLFGGSQGNFGAHRSSVHHHKPRKIETSSPH